MHNPQNPHLESASTEQPSRFGSDPLKPALASIPDACKYMGDVSRAKFYADVLPLLETIHIGTRHLVVVASIDRLIAKLLSEDASTADGLLSKSRRRGSLRSRAWKGDR